MSFGWSPSDIVSLVRLSYEVYSFCQTAPAELQGLLERLERISEKLQLFSNILEKSGLGTWKKAPALEQHLLDAQAYLETLRPVIDKGTSVPSKAKGLVRIALNQDKLKQIEKNLDVDEACIDGMKIDLILVSSLRNLRAGNDHEALRFFEPLSPPNPPHQAPGHRNVTPPLPLNPAIVSLRLEADRHSIVSMTVSNASRALEMAMELRSRRNSIIEPIAINETPVSSSRDAQLTNEFITDVISLAEETELYSKDADPTTKLDRLAKLTEKAEALQLVLPTSTIVQRLTPPPIRISGFLDVKQDSFGRQVFGQLSSTSDNASVRLWALDHSHSQSESSHVSDVGHQTPPTSCSDLAPSVRLPLPIRVRDEDEILPVDVNPPQDTVVRLDNDSSSNEPIRLRGRSKVSLSMDHNASLDCSFELQPSEGSIVMRVVSNTMPRYQPDVVFASGALPPSSKPSWQIPQPPSRRLTTTSLQAFQHCFEAQARPIPHLLHPDVEGPAEEPDAPYKITFTERQYISREDASEGPRWTTSLMYIFFDKQDQLTICEKIFGKMLIMTAGSNKVTHDGQEISHMSTVTLWFDDAAESLSITFSPNLANQRTRPKDIELRVHGLWDMKKALRNPNALALTVESVSRGQEGMNVLERPPTSQSGVSIFGRAASKAPQRGNPPSRKKCVIEFTRLVDRTSFAGHFS